MNTGDKVVVRPMHYIKKLSPNGIPYRRCTYKDKWCYGIILSIKDTHVWVEWKDTDGEIYHSGFAFSRVYKPS